MPKRRLDPCYHQWLLEGWKTFGKWLKERRIGRRFTLQQAADAVKVSKRQWIRYEQGARVPDKHLDRIASKLHIERRRIYYMAGFQVPRKRHDAPALLRRMHVTMQTGDLQTALEQFLLLYQSMRPIPPGGDDSDLDATTPVHFAQAIVCLDALPKWLFQMILKSMQKWEKEFQESGRNISFRHIVWNSSLDELDLTPPIMKGVVI
ncbi:MAG: helix-turn-helix domain-containing protein [Pyrinomonadaceae bacterium]